LRVRIEKAAVDAVASEPRIAAQKTPASLPERPPILRYGARFRAADEAAER
jgi:hypothetical protein